MRIRKASLDDFAELYKIGMATPELRVSATEEFMSPEELQWSITQRDGVFLVAEDRNLLGFVYASAEDADRPFKKHHACLVYIAVLPEARGKGVANKLYQDCVAALKEKGVTHLYTWANPRSGAIEFFRKQNLSQGHEYVWMDGKL